jgi:FkbM family methyltransferase
MSPQLLLHRLLERFNESSWWRRDCRVWQQHMAAATFDRWFYLALHRWGLMGAGERAVLRRLLRPGMQVLDVGSNIGLYTVFISRCVGPAGRVMAFEPDPRLARVLAENCRHNFCDNVTIYPQALGSKAGRAVLHTLIVNSGDNHLAAAGGRLWRRDIEVTVATADELLPAFVPDLVKIDVQGWELQVLAGMREILERNPCVMVYFEYWPAGCRRAGYEPRALLDFFRERGFALHRADDDTFLEEASLIALEQQVTGLRHVDLIARRSDGGSAKAHCLSPAL